MACGILVSQPGIQPVAPAVEAQSPNHWTTREVPSIKCFFFGLCLLMSLISSRGIKIPHTMQCGQKIKIKKEIKWILKVPISLSLPFFFLILSLFSQIALFLKYQYVFKYIEQALLIKYIISNHFARYYFSSCCIWTHLNLMITLLVRCCYFLHFTNSQMDTVRN